MGKKVLFAASTGAHIRRFHLPYLAALGEMGVRVHVVCAQPGAEPLGDRTIPVPFEKKMFAIGNFRALDLLRRELDRENYDAVIVHTSLAAFFTRFVNAASEVPHLNDTSARDMLIHNLRDGTFKVKMCGKTLHTYEDACDAITKRVFAEDAAGKPHTGPRERQGQDHTRGPHCVHHTDKASGWAPRWPQPWWGPTWSWVPGVPRSAQ